MLRVVNVVSLEGHEGIVWCVSWNGDRLASCGEDRVIKLWRETDGIWQCYKTIDTPHKRTIRCVQWSPCGSYIASCGFDGMVNVWKVNNDFECVSVLDGHVSEIKCVDWSINGQFLAACGRDKIIRIWEKVSDDDYECVSEISDHTQDVKKVKWHPDDHLFSASYDNSVRSFSYSSVFDDWACDFKSEAHQSTVWGVDFDETGNKMATCSADKTIRIWERKTVPDSNDEKWQCTFCISGHHELPIYEVSWCKKTNSIASACGDNAIRIFQKSDDENESSYDIRCTLPEAHSCDVNCVSWNPERKGLLASCSDDGLIKLWYFDIE